MKKIIFTIFVLFGLVLNTNSQEPEQAADNYLGPSAGDVSLEVNFLSPFVVGAPIQINYLKGRYFLSDEMALRLGFQFNIISETDKGGEWNSSERIIAFGLYPGIEMHFPVSNRVSPYFGGELGFFTRSTLDIIEYDDGDKAEYINHPEGAGMGYNNFLFNLVGGVDLYIYKGLYLGAELGYGLGIHSDKDSEYTIVDGDESITTTTEHNRINYFLGDRVNTSIRLGWTF